LDELIVERQKMSINDIFQQFGEAFFRKEEASVLRHT
jgi:shikimate kinase